MLTRSKTVADRLRASILSGEYAPGAHLQEVPLADEMGVSRTPVRAALATLETEGLLSYTPKRGYEVRRFGAEDILDMYRVRAVLEAHAAFECARLGLSADAYGALNADLRAGDKVLGRGHLDPADLPAYREMNHRFHEGIVRHSRSRSLVGFVAQMRQIPLLSDRIILWHDYRLIARSHDDHHRVLQAIWEQDGARASSIMHEHVYFMGRIVQEHCCAPITGAATMEAAP